MRVGSLAEVQLDALFGAAGALIFDRFGDIGPPGQAGFPERTAARLGRSAEQTYLMAARRGEPRRFQPGNASADDGDALT